MTPSISIKSIHSQDGFELPATRQQGSIPEESPETWFCLPEPGASLTF